MTAQTRFLAMMAPLALSAHAFAGGFVISDSSFFNTIPHTLIDFESLADGTPILLPENQLRSIGADEFGPLGVLIFGAPNIVNFSSPEVEAIQQQHASPDNSLILIGSAPTDPAGLGFVPGIRAWGIFITLDVSVPTPRPVFNVFSGETFFESITFEGDLVQGRVGDIEYGFVGFASDDFFDAVVFENFFRPGFDDLRFSAFPAPGTGAAFGLLALGALARRRR